MSKDYKHIALLVAAFLVLTHSVWLDFAFPHLLEVYNNYGELLIVTIVSSFFGAYGGQYIAEQKSNHRLLMEEFRATNASIMTANSILNSLINMRSQYLNALREEYYQHKAEWFLEPDDAQTKIINFIPNLLTFQTSKMPVEELKKLIFERLMCLGDLLH